MLNSFFLYFGLPKFLRHFIVLKRIGSRSHCIRTRKYFQGFSGCSKREREREREREIKRKVRRIKERERERERNKT